MFVLRLCSTAETLSATVQPPVASALFPSEAKVEEITNLLFLSSRFPEGVLLRARGAGRGPDVFKRITFGFSRFERWSRMSEWRAEIV